MPCRSPLASWFCGAFSCLVFPEDRLCLLDIGLLSRLRAAAQQDDQRVAILGQIDAITRSPINAALGDDADPLHARYVCPLRAAASPWRPSLPLGHRAYRTRLGRGSSHPREDIRRPASLPLST